MFRNMQNSEIIRRMTEEFDEVIYFPNHYRIQHKSQVEFKIKCQVQNVFFSKNNSGYKFAGNNT